MGFFKASRIKSYTAEVVKRIKENGEWRLFFRDLDDPVQVIKFFDAHGSFTSNCAVAFEKDIPATDLADIWVDKLIKIFMSVDLHRRSEGRQSISIHRLGVLDEEQFPCSADGSPVITHIPTFLKTQKNLTLNSVE
jgi:hypothetical protein